MWYKSTAGKTNATTTQTSYTLSFDDLLISCVEWEEQMKFMEMEYDDVTSEPAV